MTLVIIICIGQRFKLKGIWISDAHNIRFFANDLNSINVFLKANQGSPISFTDTAMPIDILLIEYQVKLICIRRRNSR